MCCLVFCWAKRVLASCPSMRFLMFCMSGGFSLDLDLEDEDGTGEVVSYSCQVLSNLSAHIVSILML